MNILSIFHSLHKGFILLFAVVVVVVVVVK